jgi:glycosyl transferase family 1
MELAKFFAERKQGANQFFPAENGNGKTVLLTSHIYWTDLMALALLRLGYNVIVANPWYFFWTDDNWFNNFDREYGNWINTIREQNVMCIIGGNTTAMVPHIRTGEPLHRAAGVPVVHYWWDEPRARPPMARRGVSLRDYVKLIKDDRTLNVIWDIDVYEELRAFLGVQNSVHIPIATAPDLWDEPFVPLQDRKPAACFLGNCHFLTEAQRNSFEPELATWAEGIVWRKMQNLDRGIVDCTEKTGTVVDTTFEKSIERDFRRWFIVDALLVEGHRNRAVKGLSQKLGESFTLIGGDWEKIGLKAAKKHSGVPDAKTYYGSHKASLNLYGGCVHGGMPLRPYEIAASNGLIFTHYNRELPNLFEPGKECVAFRNESEMFEQLDRIFSHPADYNRVVGAGRRRVINEHNWENRMKRVMRAVEERFGASGKVQVSYHLEKRDEDLPEDVRGPA